MYQNVKERDPDDAFPLLAKVSRALSAPFVGKADEMIILEGPDGGGKTTLLKRLCEDTRLPAHPRASDSLTGPVADLYGWTKNDLKTWDSQPLSIYDRHPLTSEHIYGPTVRGQARPGFEMKNKELAYLRRFFRDHILLIVCLPPIGVVRENITNDPNQMRGVVENIDYIYDCYRMMPLIWPLSCHVAMYDYTVDEHKRHGYDEILAAAKHHTYTWRGVKYDL